MGSFHNTLIKVLEGIYANRIDILELRVFVTGSTPCTVAWLCVIGSA